jgi:hypothetical protein
MEEAAYYMYKTGKPKPNEINGSSGGTEVEKAYIFGRVPRMQFLLHRTSCLQELQV